MLQLLPMVFIQEYYYFIKNLVLMLILEIWLNYVQQKVIQYLFQIYFGEILPGCELNSNKESDLEQATKIIKNYNIDKGYEDIVSCLQWLRETPQCNGLVTTIGYGIGANLSYLSGLWLDIESSVCYDFEGFDFFQEHDTFIRRPMLIHLCKDTYNNLKENDKLKFLDNVNNIKLNLYNNCEKNFTRISDKKFNELEMLNSQKETFNHILEAFNNPHTHS